MFVAKFITIAPIAGCSAGTSGNRRRISGAIARAIARSSPPSRRDAHQAEHQDHEAGQIDHQRAPRCFAPSKEAADTSCIRPVNAA